MVLGQIGPGTAQQVHHAIVESSNDAIIGWSGTLLTQGRRMMSASLVDVQGDEQ